MIRSGRREHECPSATDSASSAGRDHRRSGPVVASRLWGSRCGQVTSCSRIRRIPSPVTAIIARQKPQALKGFAAEALAAAMTETSIKASPSWKLGG
jgi:hypothetical protein